MRTSNLFAMALAAVSFAACSNDDAPAAGGENQGELVDAISVYFTNPKTTYAYSDAVGGNGTESNVYHAFIFAKENNPEHAAALVGDWTVKEVKGEGTDPIEAGDEGKSSTLKNMATFKGVRQGDNVYVIANDPNMNLSAAERMAHQGKDSEAAIKAYTSTLTKEYLNGLAVKSDKAVLPAGKFIMAGKATIPTNPTQPNNTTMRVPVTLDREVAKVVFSATVTNKSEQEAYTKVKIKEDDGIIIARIPRSVSFYADQERDWYFPLNGDITTKDWGTDWVVAFDGEKKTDPKTSGIPAFNNTAKKGAKEYRYTWDTKSSLVSYTEPSAADPVDGGKIASPIFYVTPNYANHSSCATVIVTQATYVGDNTLVRDVTAEILKDALKKNIFPGVTEITGNFWEETGEDDNISKLYTFLTANYANLFPTETYGSKSDLIGYKKNDKVYYRVDVSNYTDDNLTSLNVTERNTFYQIQGNISSLGAKTVDAAIEGSELGMIVQVTVNPWQVVVNRVDM